MPTKHALVIGIDQYRNFEEKYQLSGCVNDARLIKRVLVDHFNFEESNIAELHNAAASQKGILAAMDQLVERVSQDDIVVFHYSGHGSQRTSASADEGTGMDSTITPADSGCVDPFPNLNIIDDEIHQWLERLAVKTHNITLIFDCCHSGTITRNVVGAPLVAQARSVPADRRSLESMGVEPANLPQISRSTSRATGSGGWLALSDSYVVMSGCRDDEFSFEFESEAGEEVARNGALTHFLTNALVRAQPGTTYRDVFELTRQGVNTMFPEQHPQMEGSQDKEIFGVKDIEPLRYIPITSIDGEKVTLGGGAAHGLFADSHWTAYPPGTKQTEGCTPQGVIAITRVGALTTEGLIREGRDKLSVGARCIETAPAAGQFLLKIDLSHLQEGSGSKLEKRIEQSQLLTLAKSPGSADLCVHVLAPGAQLAADLPVPKLAEIEAPTWVVVDRAGALAMPPHAVSEDHALDTLVSNFEATARYRNALRLDNPASELNVEFNIYSVGAEEELQLVNGGGHVFEEGDRLVFEVVNHENTNVFVSVLDFGLTGRVALFYPPKRASEMIAPGQTLRVGEGKRRVRLGIPPELLANQGTETMKAFITSDETDFRWLQQEGTRSIDTFPSALRQQFEAAYSGPTTRYGYIEEDDASGDWKAIGRSFGLRRRPV